MSNVTIDNPVNKNSPISSKIDRTIVIQTEFIKALKEHGCPSCLQLLREIIKKYSDSSLLTATNLKPTAQGDVL
jgi:hypothetical protein